MPSSNDSVRTIIHVASMAAGSVGAGLAQLPGADAPVLCSIQTVMIAAVADQHGVKLTRLAAADMLLTFSATCIGRGVSQWLVGWIPGWGNAINASTAIALTEAVGWTAHDYFRRSGAVQRAVSK